MKVQASSVLFGVGSSIPFVLLLEEFYWSQFQILILSVLILYLSVALDQRSNSRAKRPDQLTRIPNPGDFVRKASENEIFRVKK